MKLIIILIITFLSLSTVKNDELNGKWKLMKIETSEKLIFPKKVEYFLTISSNRMEYNLDINKCCIENVTFNDGLIKYEMVGCTKICCDGSFDTISKYINYHGSYKVIDSTLKIQNNNGIFYLKKL